MEHVRQPLDTWDLIPDGMRMYLRNYGRHFNKKMYEYAVSNMYRINKNTKAKEYMTPLNRERYEEMLKKYNIKLEHDVLYDGMYIMSMAMADFFGSSLPNEQVLVLFVKDYVDDVDQTDGFIFNRFYADCVLNGTPIEWDDMI
jgi:hypothetical protein